jgi:hypothetical protein
MAIEYIGVTATTGTTSVNPYVIAYPSGIAKGDLLILVITCPGALASTNNVSSLPSGWQNFLATNRNFDFVDSTGTNNRIITNYHGHMMYKVCDGSESGNLSVTMTAAGFFNGVMIAYRGCNPYTPICWGLTDAMDAERRTTGTGPFEFTGHGKYLPWTGGMILAISHNYFPAGSISNNPPIWTGGSNSFTHRGTATYNNSNNSGCVSIAERVPAASESLTDIGGTTGNYCRVDWGTVTTPVRQNVMNLLVPLLPNCEFWYDDWKFPGTTATESATALGLADGPNWNNPGNVTANDGTYANKVASAGNWDSDLLKCTNFGFAIPGDVQIIGIEVRFGVYSVPNVSTIYTHNSGYLVIGGTTAATALGGGGTQSFKAHHNRHQCTSTDTSANEVDFYLGGIGDLWGYKDITPADINSSSFGFSLEGNYHMSATGGNCTHFCDYIQMKIWYAAKPQTILRSVI